MINIIRKAIAAPVKRFFGSITHVKTDKPYAAITFDDGPDPEFTPLVLETLAKHNAKATFFMIGERAEKHKDIVKLVADAKHSIGNHSWDHPSLPKLSGSERRKQIKKCLNSTAPYSSNLFRPPYGHQSIGSRIDALLLGLKVIAWNVDVWDWSKEDINWMSEQLISKTKSGTIILLHDSIYEKNKDGLVHSRKYMISALDKFLTETKDKYQYVTIPELIKSGKPIKVNWFRKAKT